MHPGPRFLLLLPLAALIACGSSSSSPSATAPATNILTGEWAIGGTTLQTGADVIAGALLQASNGSITGTMAVFLPFYNTPSCADQWQALAVTGTVDASNNLTLTIPLGSTQGTATITAALNANPETPANGSLQITGGNCAMSSTPIVITQYAPLTGTYTGTLYKSDPNTGAILPATATTVTAVLTQSTTPDSYGEFPVNGTVTSTGAYATHYTLNGSVPIDGAFLGVQQYPLLEGLISPSASTISAIFEVNAVDTAYYGTLTRQ